MFTNTFFKNISLYLKLGTFKVATTFWQFLIYENKTNIVVYQQITLIQPLGNVARGCNSG